ncbi:hypothetical protein N2152v2_006333 [Parachlorella kessleri]
MDTSVLEQLGATEAVEIDTEHGNRKIWLLKVPNFLAHRWKTVCDKAMNEGTEPVGPKLGTIRYSRSATDSTGKPQPNFSLRLDSDSTRDVPQEYNMAMASGSLGTISLAAFSEGSGRVAAEGRVDQKFDLEVVRRATVSAADGAVEIDPEYRQLSRQRAQAAATKTRTVQLVSGQEMARQRGVASIGVKRKDTSDKRVSKPREELLAQLFKLFERQSHWAFAQLQIKTEQPTTHLKNILSEIAVINKNGPYKGLWSLKKENLTSAAAQPSVT